jgi:hypothetical protein
MKRLLLFLMHLPILAHSQRIPWANLIKQVDSNQTFARTETDRQIFKKVIAPFIYSNLKDTERLSKSDLPVSYDEADWRVLTNLIRQTFGKSQVKINLLHAKLAWYKMHNNWQAYANAASQRFELRPPDTTNHRESDLVDTYASLLYKAGKKPEAIKWQIESVKMEPANKKHLVALRAMINGESAIDSP